jgi:hypothetical protein
MFIECRHILPSGLKCKSPALRNQVYCYFHQCLQRFEQDGLRDTSEPLCLPPLEDARGIQIAIAQILTALGSGRIDRHKAGLYLYGLQLALQALPHLPFTYPPDVVRELACDEAGQFISAEETPFTPLPAPKAAGLAAKLLAASH